MADHAVEDDFDGDIFIYRGGRAPLHITHACIDESVSEIEGAAFRDCDRLVQVDTHDGIRKIGAYAFTGCRSLPQINLKSAVEIEEYAFYFCRNLESVEFGDRLERIGNRAFYECSSLKHLKLPSIISIVEGAFGHCTYLSDVELSEQLETIQRGAFYGCKRLQRIAIPLKRDLFEFDQWVGYTQFNNCAHLTTVDIVGQEHTLTVASLHMESWKTDMIAELSRINQVLPNTPGDEKTAEIQQWMEVVLDKKDHYKAEHYKLLKEAATLLELTLWKANLGENEDECGEGRTKKAKVDAEFARKDKRMTCGAEIIIKNVLPFLQLKE